MIKTLIQSTQISWILLVSLRMITFRVRVKVFVWLKWINHGFFTVPHPTSKTFYETIHTRDNCPQNHFNEQNLKQQIANCFMADGNRVRTLTVLLNAIDSFLTLIQHRLDTGSVNWMNWKFAVDREVRELMMELRSPPQELIATKMIISHVPG